MMFIIQNPVVLEFKGCLSFKGCDFWKNKRLFQTIKP